MVSRMPHTSSFGDLTVHDWDGPPGATPLFLMHGLTDSGECWADAVARWAPRFRVLSWDARGHGTSGRFTPGQLEVGVGETMLADAVAVLESLVGQGVARPILVGHSMGGGTAGSVVATRPDLVRAAVLEDPALGEAEGETESHRREAAVERVADAQLWLEDPEAAQAKGMAENPDWPEAEYAAWARSKRQTDLAMLATGQARVRRNWREVYRDIAAPTLFLAAAETFLWKDDDLAELERLQNPHVRLLRVPESGHCIRRTQTEAFHRLVDPWLDEQK